MKVLLVDDEIVALNALRKRVDWAKYGFAEVLTASNAVEAKSILQKTAVDLALLDVEMPGETGLELVQWIREQEINTDCIMVTCHADFNYLREGMRNGIVEYILKPIDYEELYEVLTRYVEIRNKNEEKTMISKLVEKVEQKHGADAEPADRLAVVKAYIEEHISEKIYVEDLAKLVYMNEQYFMRVFKRETGKSVTDYLTERRVLLASTMLRETSRSINFISDCVGCENCSYFTKIFKKNTGMTPSEYRNSFQKS